MTITPLVKTTLLGHVDDKERVLAELQELGCLHLIPLTPEGEPSGETGAKRESREALKFLAGAPQRRRQMLDPSRFDPVEVERQALELQRRLFELRNERDLLELRIEALRPWGDFEFPPLEELGDQRLWFYPVPHHQLKELPTEGLRWEVVGEDHRFCYVVVVAEEEPEPDALPVPRIHTGSRSLRELLVRLEDVLVEIEDVEAERYSMTRWCTLFGRALDGLDDRAERTRASAQTARAEPLYARQAWAPRARLPELEAYAANGGLVLEAAEPEEGEEPPTQFENPAPLRGGEDLVTFYMTPGYWVWDPSSVVFFSFAVFFAMILADVGYALLLGAIPLLYWKRMGQSDTGRRWRILLATLAGATAVYGVLIGSYFGVAPEPGSFLGRFKVLDLNDFSTAMYVAIAIGALHIAYANVRDGLRYRDWQKRLAPFGWATVVLGGFCGWTGLQAESDPVTRAGVGIAVAGLLAVVGFAGAGEPPLKRVVAGVSALTGLSSAFGDVLSYLRLFALGLASGALASAFNGMAADVREAVPGIGFFFALLVLLIGHSLNFVLSLSSGFIHGLRLNVIEFFKWGVKDEGTPYRPYARKESTSWTTSS
ncbi:MAG: V-type ATP synthase subunit I [Myxococcota bacterium]